MNCENKNVEVGMELKGRLKAIADFVEQCDTVCDVGTDHAYVPIYLIKKNICSKCIASDIREGPLKIAWDNIVKEGVENRIEIRKGNGLEPLSDMETETVILAGMGGMLINKILSQAIDKTRKSKSIILQPMNAVDKTRKWLLENGYNISREVLKKEERKIYCIIEANWCGNTQKTDDVYYFIGKKLIDEKDPLLMEYIEKNLKVLDKRIKGIMLSSHKNDLDEVITIRDKIAAVYENLVFDKGFECRYN